MHVQGHMAYLPSGLPDCSSVTASRARVLNSSSSSNRFFALLRKSRGLEPSGNMATVHRARIVHELRNSSQFSRPFTGARHDVCACMHIPASCHMSKYKQHMQSTRHLCPQTRAHMAASTGIMLLQVGPGCFPSDYCACLEETFLHTQQYSYSGHMRTLQV